MSPTVKLIHRQFLPVISHQNVVFFLCRFVKTTANATVDHLSKYLALRIALEEGQTNGETEDRGREEGGGGAEGRTGSGEGSGLNSISEKQYTIYILTRGGQFSVSVHSSVASDTLQPVTKSKWRIFKG